MKSILSVFLSLAALVMTRAEEAKPLNVLLILIEDQGAHLGMLGTPALKTPRMDALAKEGVFFKQYYVGYPVCSASKACIYTSMYPHRNGLVNNVENFFKPAAELTEKERAAQAPPHVRIADSVPVFTEMLNKNGYFTGVSGKLHVAPNERFNYDEFIGHKSGGAAESSEEGGGFSGNKSNIIGPFVQRAKAAGKPWFYFDNHIWYSHRPFAKPGDKRKIEVNPDDVQLPAYLPDTPTCRLDWAEYLDAIQRNDVEVGKTIDDLKATGEFEHTLIILMAGDHGPAFQHGKVTPYELGLHVNLTVVAPGGTRGVISDALASSVDLMPTILDYVGLPIPGSIDGKSLRPIIEGNPNAAGHEFVFSECSGRAGMQKVGMEERSVIDGRFHLIARSRLNEPRLLNADSFAFEKWGNRVYNETIKVKEQFPIQYEILAEMDTKKLKGKPPAIEFYDLSTDRDEMHNLAENPSARKDLERLYAALKKWNIDTQDVIAPVPPLPPVK